MVAEQKIARPSSRLRCRTWVVRGVAAGAAAWPLLLSALLAAPEKPPNAQDKLPIPAEASQARAREFLKGAFSEEFDRAKTPADWRLLAKTMMDEADKSDLTPADRFVMLEKARQLAIDANDLEAAEKAIRCLAARFDLDPLPIEVQAMTALAKGSLKTDQKRAIAERALALMDRAAQQNEFELAIKLGAAASATGRSFKDLAVVTRVEDLNSAATAYEKAKSALEKSARTVDDPEANLLAGKYRCFYQNNWELGLPLLILGNDPTLENLARADSNLAHAASGLPTEGTDRLKLADRWEEYGQKLVPHGAPQRNVLRHAAQWYLKALPAIRGLNRVRIIKVVHKIESETQTPRLIAPDLHALKAKRLFQDDFEDPKSGFRTDKDPQGNWFNSYHDGKWCTGTPGGHWTHSAPWKLDGEVAVQVVGRVVSAETSAWQCGLYHSDTNVGFLVAIESDGKCRVSPYDAKKTSTPDIKPFDVPGLLKGDQFNELLLVLKNQRLEIYLNDLPACSSIALDQDMSHSWLVLGPDAPRGGTAEFERVTVWSAAALPNLATAADGR